jgi:translation elongation factor EF-1beta
MKNRIEKSIDTAITAIKSNLKKFNKKRENARQETLKQIGFGIRDIWASETIEDAKAIVEKFVQ